MTSLLKRNNVLFLFLLLPFFAMIIPVVINYGNGNIFLMDYLAKRIMTLGVLPLIGLLTIYLFYEFVFNTYKINPFLSLYFIVWLSYFIYSLFQKTSIDYLLVDAFVSFLPIFFYVPINNLNFSLSKKQFIILLYLAYFLTVFNIKLQFSYFNLIGIVYVLFIAKVNFKNVLLFVTLPIVTLNALLGKSALIMLAFLIGTLYFRKFSFVKTSRKRLITIVFVFSVIFGGFFLGNYITKTGSYRNFTYFIRNTNFSELEFKDASTGNRLFEAKKVLEFFNETDLTHKFLGNGYGSVIDLSETMDATVILANSNPKAVHNIHMGVFAVLYRYGILGLFIYLTYLIIIVKKSVYIIRNSNSLIHVLLALYILILSFDSLISFPHMMSNFLFWFASAYILFHHKVLLQNNLNAHKIYSDETKLELIQAS